MHTPDQKPRNRLWTLFTSMLTISSFTFGGGFVIVTLMKRRFVDELGWMDEDEMLDIAAMAQSTPGAIAVNAAVLTGTQSEILSRHMITPQACTPVPRTLPSSCWANFSV